MISSQRMYTLQGARWPFHPCHARTPMYWKSKTNFIHHIEPIEGKKIETVYAYTTLKNGRLS